MFKYKFWTSHSEHYSEGDWSAISVGFQESSWFPVISPTLIDSSFEQLSNSEPTKSDHYIEKTLHRNHQLRNHDKRENIPYVNAVCNVMVIDICWMCYQVVSAAGRSRRREWTRIVRRRFANTLSSRFYLGLTRLDLLEENYSAPVLTTRILVYND
jgi:hypothetical protein